MHALLPVTESRAMAFGTELIDLVVGCCSPAIQHKQIPVFQVVTTNAVDVHTVIHENIFMVARLNRENPLRSKNLVAVLAIALEMIDDR
jgi:hypothetical protein